MEIEEFLNYVKENKRVSDNTMEAYKQDLHVSLMIGKHNPRALVD